MLKFMFLTVNFVRRSYTHLNEVRFTYVKCHAHKLTQMSSFLIHGSTNERILERKLANRQIRGISAFQKSELSGVLCV